jgi:hypothetical protein
MADDFLGVPDEVITLYGKMVVVSGRLEKIAISIAETFAVTDASARSFKELVDEIEGRAKQWGVPPWATCSRDDVVSWARDASAAMKKRNFAFHASAIFRATKAGWRLVSLNHKKASGSRLSSRSVGGIFKHLLAADSAGYELHSKLLHQTAPGAFQGPGREAYLRDEPPGAVRMSINGGHPFLRDPPAAWSRYWAGFNPEL